MYPIDTAIVVGAAIVFMVITVALDYRKLRPTESAPVAAAAAVAPPAPAFGQAGEAGVRHDAPTALAVGEEAARVRGVVERGLRKVGCGPLRMVISRSRATRARRTPSQRMSSSRRALRVRWPAEPGLTSGPRGSDLPWRGSARLQQALARHPGEPVLWSAGVRTHCSVA